jgi:hypothetical protein
VVPCGGGGKRGEVGASGSARGRWDALTMVPCSTNDGQIGSVPV